MYLRSKHSGPKLTSPLTLLSLCHTAMYGTPWDSSYLISVNEVVDTNCKVLIVKLKQMEAGKALDKEKGIHVNTGKSPKNGMPHDKKRIKDSTTNGTCTGNPGGGKKQEHE